jgi:hypothetical protein
MDAEKVVVVVVMVWLLVSVSVSVCVCVRVSLCVSAGVPGGGVAGGGGAGGGVSAVGLFLSIATHLQPESCECLVSMVFVHTLTPKSRHSTSEVCLQLHCNDHCAC